MTELISKQAPRALEREDRTEQGVFLMFSPSLAQEFETMDSYVCCPIKRNTDFLPHGAFWKNSQNLEKASRKPLGHKACLQSTRINVEEHG